MAKLRFGERVAREATLQVGASALILDELGERVLLTRRTDNGRWCLSGGRTDPGESLAETLRARGARGDGLEVEVVRLVGVYSSPRRGSPGPVTQCRCPRSRSPGRRSRRRGGGR